MPRRMQTDKNGNWFRPVDDVTTRDINYPVPKFTTYEHICLNIAAQLPKAGILVRYSYIDDPTLDQSNHRRRIEEQNKPWSQPSESSRLHSQNQEPGRLKRSEISGPSNIGIESGEPRQSRFHDQNPPRRVDHISNILPLKSILKRTGPSSTIQHE